MDTWSWSKWVGTTPEGNCQTSQEREAQGMDLDKEQLRRVSRRELRKKTGQATEERT